MKSVMFLVLFVVCITASAQDAKVIALSPAESAQIKSLHEQQKSIADKIEAFDQEIRMKYLSAAKDEEGHTNTYSYHDKWIWVKSGWGSGQFRYSEDFKYIVPLVPMYPSSGGSGWGWGGCATIDTLTPAYPITGSITTAPDSSLTLTH